ncbi:reticulocyte-binding protein 2 a isoform X3 [Biomphalaria glabrata]|nr:reticulocyte-binding protein 2 a isoform X3 [Biomphalaria glabrata]
MRTYQEVSDTVEQLKHLDEINEFLHNVFDEISLIKKKGELWIEENETSTFTEMKEYITGKTSEILQHTISVASTFIENLVDTAPVSKQVDKDGGVVKPGVCPEENQTSEKINVNKINYLFTSQSTKLKKLQQKVIEQQMINEDLGKKLDTSLHKDEQETPLQLKDLQENLNKQLDRFKEDVMSELHSAVIFITHLQTQWETWLKEQKSNKEINLLQLGLKANDKIVIQGQKNLSTTQEDILKTPDHLAKADTHNDFEKELNEIKDN